MNLGKRRIIPGKKMQYSSKPLDLLDTYAEFISRYDWCEENIGPYNELWSVVWIDKHMEWHFANREDLTRFIMIWF